MPARRPNLFIVGAPRSGTTSMWAWLWQHPQVFMSPWKEPMFFGRDLHDPERVPGEEEYLALFARAGRRKVVGEGSVWYLHSSTAAREIHDFAPEARILLLLRNPVDAMLSLHHHHVYAGYQGIRDFDAALATQGEVAPSQETPSPRSFRETVSYRGVFRYAPQVERYLDVFGDEPVHVVLFHDLVQDPAGTYARVLRFLGVRDDHRPRFVTHNPQRRFPFPRLSRALGRFRATQMLRKALARPFSPTLSPSRRSQLIREMEDDVRALEALLGLDLSAWRMESGGA